MVSDDNCIIQHSYRQLTFLYSTLGRERASNILWSCVSDMMLYAFSHRIILFNLHKSED